MTRVAFEGECFWSFGTPHFTPYPDAKWQERATIEPWSSAAALCCGGSWKLAVPSFAAKLPLYMLEYIGRGESISGGTDGIEQPCPR
jgi:hypothetical protein